MAANRVKVVCREEDALNGEKVSVNMNAATLAQIDLLVDKGYYSNRSAFINEAVNQALGDKQNVIDRIVDQQKTSQKLFFIGITHLEKYDFEMYKARNQRHRISGYGVLILQSGIDDLILETVESIHVVGKVCCSERIRKAYLEN